MTHPIATNAPAAPRRWWQRLAEFAAAVEYSPAEVHAARLARIEAELRHLSDRLAALQPPPGEY